MGTFALALALGLLARPVVDDLAPRFGTEPSEDAWDRLLIRLRSKEKAVLLRVKLRSGGEIFGAFAERGRGDWLSDGAGILLDLEVALGPDGTLTDVPGSQGVFVPGDEVAAVSVVELQAE